MTKRFMALPSVPDGQVLATTSMGPDGTPVVAQQSDRRAPCAGAMTKRLLALPFSPDGQVLATASMDQKAVRLWSLSNPTAEPRVLRGP